MTSPPPASLPLIHLFTDGACSGNPGPGGWAFLLRDLRSGSEKEASGGAGETTNNQMELMAVIRGLQALKRPCDVTLYADSKYVGQGITSWLPGWKARGWKRKQGSRLVPIKNQELWQTLDQLLSRHRFQFEHIKGHAGHEENERCDQLAVAAAKRYATGVR